MPQFDRTVKVVSVERSPAYNCSRGGLFVDSDKKLSKHNLLLKGA